MSSIKVGNKRIYYSQIESIETTENSIIITTSSGAVHDIPSATPEVTANKIDILMGINESI